jgi:abortive infection bacteriophage resistance protein
MKHATTVEQQMETLKNRGMQIDIGEEKIKEILYDIGYFRLGFYCFPFETGYPNKIHRTHQYRQDTRFSDVLHLYYLDDDLRHLLLKYLNRIEINFRTKIVYFVSNQYIHNNAWFIDLSVMEKSFIDRFDAEFYTENFKKNPVIKNHHKKYPDDNYAPAWKTLEFFTFGSILKVFQSLKDQSLRQSISLQYGVKNINTFENYFRAIVELRNLCAHGSALFDHKLTYPLRNGIALTISDKNRNKIFSVITILHFILQKISHNSAKDMENEINSLFDQFSSSLIIKEIINNSIGRRNF